MNEAALLSVWCGVVRSRSTLPLKKFLTAFKVDMKLKWTLITFLIYIAGFIVNNLLVHVINFVFCWYPLAWLFAIS